MSDVDKLRDRFFFDWGGRIFQLRHEVAVSTAPETLRELTYRDFHVFRIAGAASLLFFVNQEYSWGESSRVAIGNYAPALRQTLRGQLTLHGNLQRNRIIRRMHQVLLGAEVPLSGLHRCMSEQHLNLL
jgi:hypothetical protein